MLTLGPWLILTVLGAQEWLKKMVVGYTPDPMSARGSFFPASMSPSTFSFNLKVIFSTNSLTRNNLPDILSGGCIECHFGSGRATAR